MCVCISRSVWPILIKSGMMMHTGHLRRAYSWNFKFLKIQMVVAATWISQNRDILTMVWPIFTIHGNARWITPFWTTIKSPYLPNHSPDFDKILFSDAHWLLQLTEHLNSEFLKFYKAVVAIWKVKNEKIAICQQQFDRSARNLAS